MTTDTLERTDTGTQAAVREADERDPACYLCGCHGWTPDAPLPAEVSEPQCLHVIARRSGQNKRAYPKDNWQDVSHATAVAFGRRWADLHDMAAEFRAWVDSLPGVPEVEWAELPPPPEEQLRPDALDAEAQQRQATVSPQLTAKWQQPDDEPEPEPDEEQPEPRSLLRAELRALWDDLRSLWADVRSWRPRKRGGRR